MLTAAVVVISVVLLAVLAVYLVRTALRPSPAHLTASPPEQVQEKKKIPCILCGAKLVGREKIKSKRYNGEKEDLVYIYGCPYCYGDAAVNSRTCPVCRRVMELEDYLVGRMWPTKKGKLHLHVSGCTRCR
jgi:hypothetical protein